MGWGGALTGAGFRPGSVGEGEGLAGGLAGWAAPPTGAAVGASVGALIGAGTAAGGLTGARGEGVVLTGAVVEGAAGGTTP